MSEKFTKGPWSKNGRLIYSNEKFVAIVSQTDISDWSILESNSSLIAAAPDMYEMLSKLSGMATDINAHALAKEIESLLSKARGEA